MRSKALGTAITLWTILVGIRSTGLALHCPMHGAMPGGGAAAGQMSHQAVRGGSHETTPPPHGSCPWCNGVFCCCTVAARFCPVEPSVPVQLMVEGEALFLTEPAPRSSIVPHIHPPATAPPGSLRFARS